MFFDDVGGNVNCFQIDKDYVQCDKVDVSIGNLVVIKTDDDVHQNFPFLVWTTLKVLFSAKPDIPPM
mgnify:FL=1